MHQTAWIEEGAVLGKNNYVGPFCYIGANVQIGDNNLFAGHISIGMEAEHRDYFRTEGEIIIGSHNIVREFCTINSSTKWVTRMGNRCVMLRGSHLSHDSILEDRVNISCNVLIGGESYVMSGANIGLGAIIHQRQLIGSHTMIGMGAVITKGLEVQPGNIFVGNPARFLKENVVGKKRAGVTNLDMREELFRFQQLKKKGWL